MPAKPKAPKYCLHTPSGRAYVRIRGRVIYCGKHGTPESLAEYGRLLAEYAANPTASRTAVSAAITTVEMAAAYLDFAEGYYVKHGQPTSQLNCVTLAIRQVRELYGHTPAADFGPLALRAIQQRMIDADFARKTINSTVGQIKRMFKWAASREMIPAATYHGLATVDGLRRGRTAAKEPKPVLPVADTVIEATLPTMTKVVAAMVRFQRLTGCRPGEVCDMRPMDIDRAGEVWTYRPARHKTEHHGRERTISVGPKAQAVLAPYLERDDAAYCFSPAESEAGRYAELRQRRKSKVQPSQLNRRKRHRLRAPNTKFNTNSYGHSIRHAIAKANKQIAELAKAAGVKPVLIPHWHANQIRHTSATEVRKHFGIEAAQCVAGHSKANTTEIYAERDATLAAAVMRKIG